MFVVSSRAARLFVLLYAVGVACAATPDSAGDASRAPSLTLREAVARTLARNPQLRTFTFRMQAQEGRERIAGLRPPVELRAELENVGATDATGTGATEATLALSGVLELGDKRAQRLEAARAAGELIATEREAAELDVIAEVTRRFIQVASDQAQLRLTVRATQLAEQAVKAVQRRVDAGRSPDVELNRTRIALTRARIAEEHAQHALRASRRKLAAMWGDTEEDFGEVTARLFEVPAVPPFDDLAAQIDSNPDFARFASEARLRDAELNLARARARADVTWTAGVRRLQALDDNALVLGASVPLFSGSRAEGAVAEARAQRALTDAERDAHRVRVLAELYALYQELNHAVNETEELQRTVSPEMEAALRATENAFERGRYGYLELAEAQREFLDVQRALITSAANTHLFRVEIERLTGRALPGAP
ncbi:MAG: TolC family protein [Steroidobacteraceae bacterium]|nr:TolC family protein [Steroidobacteraceae bacterium]